MHTLGDMAKRLHRPVVYLHGLISRFGLPVNGEAGYPETCLAFLRTVIYLRVLNIPEDSLRELWGLEKKLLQLLHVDTTGSPAWFLDACGKTTHRRRRLLLTNHDMGVELGAQSLQPGLDFAAAPTPELFAGTEMGEDALRVLAELLTFTRRIQAEARQEVPLVQAATRWVKAWK